MGQKLSPPQLSGTIPAFYSNDEGIVITIPFSMNRVVSLSQVDGFQIKIKTIQSGEQLCSIYVTKSLNQGNEIQFIIKDDNKNKFKIGQYYKVQVAYVNDNVIGYYSTVAIGKYTTKPNVFINGLDETILNSHNYIYTGIYDQSNKDKSERLASYRFDLYDSENNLIDSSGDLLHDTTKDDTEVIGQAEDSYTFSQDLDLGKTHRIEFIVTTINGLVTKSPRYRITQKQSINPELNATLEAILNFDNGYVDVNLKAKSIEELASGFFIVSRACEDSNYTVWEEIHRFSLTAQVATRHLCRDFTVEQGKNYIYAVQQYNSNNLRSNRICSEKIYIDFEDAFLYDGKRQLKIKYNPKVSSFKKDLLETKTDTIGGKHPFIFRNGRVYYSEFPISGLISYQMDEENLFLSDEDYILSEKTTNLTGNNIASERIFKMKVLEWLTNGEPKLFRSPTEGNYIVRLMNSSMTPNDTVGRMLHTFTSTAYEIADFNYSTLGELGFIEIKNQNISSLQWETIEFTQKQEDGRIIPIEINKNLLEEKGHNAITLRFDNMNPGDIITILFENGISEDIKIGVTGSYYIDTDVLITGVILKTPSFGSMTYSYYFTKEPMFNKISDVEILEMPLRQFIGEHDILKELLYVYDNNNDTWIKNPKTELIEIYRIDVEKRPLQRLNLANKSLCIDPFLIYELGAFEEQIGVSPSRPTQSFILEEYYDAYNNISYDNSTANKKRIYEPFISINNNIVSVNEIEKTHYIKPGKLNELKSGNGVLANISYQMGIIKYTIEDVAYQNKNNKYHYLYALGQAIVQYEKSLNNLENLLKDNSAATAEEIAEARSAVNQAYVNYIIELVEGQKEDARRRGEIA